MGEIRMRPVGGAGAISTGRISIANSPIIADSKGKQNLIVFSYGGSDLDRRSQLAVFLNGATSSEDVEYGTIRKRDISTGSLEFGSTTYCKYFYYITW